MKPKPSMIDSLNAKPKGVNLQAQYQSPKKRFPVSEIAFIFGPGQEIPFWPGSGMYRATKMCPSANHEPIFLAYANDKGIPVSFRAEARVFLQPENSDQTISAFTSNVEVLADLRQGITPFFDVDSGKTMEYAISFQSMADWDQRRELIFQDQPLLTLGDPKEVGGVLDPLVEENVLMMAISLRSKHPDANAEALQLGSTVWVATTKRMAVWQELERIVEDDE